MLKRWLSTRPVASLLRVQPGGFTVEMKTWGLRFRMGLEWVENELRMS
jgi:hypothetical protein